jgi:hypothetical protein
VSAARDLVNTSIQGLRVRLSVAWEPKAKPISISLPLSTVTARDDCGNLIPADGATGRLNAAVESGVWNVDMDVPLRLPPREARFIESLQGTFEVTIAGQVATFEFGELENRQEQKRRYGEVTVTLANVRQNDDAHEFTVRVEFDDAADALESHRGWILKNHAFVLGAAGRRIEPVDQRLINQSEDGVQITYAVTLDQPLSESTFVYRTPALIIRQPIPFVLEHIALP